jgi:hypothetical protein
LHNLKLQLARRRFHQLVEMTMMLIAITSVVNVTTMTTKAMTTS